MKVITESDVDNASFVDDADGDYLDRQEDEMSPIERWANACEKAIRAVEMVSFEKQGKTAIEQAWELVWLARKLAGIENEPERFTAEQVEFLLHVGVRVEPRTNGAPIQAVFNDRAAKVEERLKRLREDLEEVVTKHLSASEDADEEGERCFVDPEKVVGITKDCSGTGWYRCQECAQYSGRRRLPREEEWSTR